MTTRAPPNGQLSRSPLRRTYAAVSAAVLLGVFFVGLVGVQTLRQMEGERAVASALRQSHARRADLQELFSLLQDAETGQRGYQLTGQTAFLAPYEEAEAALDPALDGLAAHYGPRASTLTALNQLVAEEREILRRGLTARDGRSTASADPVAGALAGKQAMDRVRQEVSDLLQNEAVYLAELRARSAARVRASRDAVLGLGVLAMALMIGSGLIILRFLRHQQGLLVTLAASARKQEAMFDGSRTPLLVLTADARINQINPATEHLFGWTAEELLGADISMLIDPTGPGDAQILNRLANRRGYLEAEVEGTICGLKRDGTRFAADISVNPIGAGKDSYIIAAVRDVSERRRIEEMKSQFVSTVSHELRTPLTSIVGSLGLLAGGAAGPLPEKAARLIGIAQSNSQRLVRLINDILDIEKIESGEMTLRRDPVEVRDLAGRSIDSVRGMADATGVSVVLTAGAPAMVSGDLDRLIQVVVNLLSNAVKFSPPGETVEVTAEPVGRIIRLSVRDRGPGIPDAFRARIFDKFAQADASDSRQRGGTGLGLAISREIAERHGGRLWFESVVDQGSTFHLDLPMTAAVETTAPEASRPRLLIVEDEADSAEVLRSILVEEGFRADVASTAREGLAAARGGDYAAALVDLQLPDGDGLGLIRALRSRPETRDLPVVVVSADVTRGIGRGYPLEVLDWLEKPLEPERLRAALDLALSRCAARRPLVLQVDYEPDIRRLTASALTGAAELISAGSLAEARARLAERRPDLVILELGLPDGSGLELLGDLQVEDGPSVPVIIYSAHETDAALLQGVEVVLLKSSASLATLARTVRQLTRKGSVP